ncbi:MAG TPA: PQQ-dependent sugar dehydrogenase [Saprospiraceae bacterium]|nr:PQQ-dependent sugar dehydrogenase [Saprospiraceae bacterium]
MKFVKILLVILAVIVIILLVARYKFSVNPPLGLLVKPNNTNLPLEKLKLPEGFVISIFADSVVNARSLSYSPSGTLFVSTRSEGNVYALKDTDGDYIADKRYTIIQGGNMPNGVAFKDGDLYIAEVNRILKISDIESKLDNPGTPEIIYDKYPTDKHHGWKYIAFGPDGKLYVPVGAPCNICESKEKVYASMTRMNLDGSDMEVVHSGIRNSVGFDWHPVTKKLYFTDNGRDMMGDDVPKCELNYASSENMHFGFPYCHQGDTPDPEFGKTKKCDEFTPPAAKLGPHTAPLGMTFYTGNQFPEIYHNQIFIARHGSWNRSKKSGYDIVLATLNADGTVLDTKPFITGWLDEGTDDVWGRPVDMELLPDGSMLISDDYADVVYRVYYKG